MILAIPSCRRLPVWAIRARWMMPLILLLLAFGCQSRGPLLGQGAPTSAEDLCQRALEGLAANNLEALERLRLTRFEHDSLLVPQMPIGNASRELVDLNMAWVMMDRSSIKGLRRALADYGGHRYKLVRVEFPAPPERYGPFTVHRETLVTVRDSAGAELRLPIFGSLVEAEGRFKLAAFID